jgi:hypothetical protein
MPLRLMIAGATTTVEHLLRDPAVAPCLGAMVTPNTGNDVARPRGATASMSRCGR